MNIVYNGLNICQSRFLLYHEIHLGLFFILHNIMYYYSYAISRKVINTYRGTITTFNINLFFALKQIGPHY